MHDSYISTAEDWRERHFAAAVAIAPKYGVMSFDAYVEKRNAIDDEKGWARETLTEARTKQGYIATVTSGILDRLRDKLAAEPDCARLHAVDALARIGHSTTDAWSMVWHIRTPEPADLGNKLMGVK